MRQAGEGKDARAIDEEHRVAPGSKPGGWGRGAMKMRARQQREIHHEHDRHERQHGRQHARAEAPRQRHREHGEVLADGGGETEDDPGDEPLIAKGQPESHERERGGDRVELAVIHGEQQTDRAQHVERRRATSRAGRHEEEEREGEIGEDRGDADPEMEGRVRRARRRQRRHGQRVVSEQERGGIGGVRVEEVAARERALRLLLLLDDVRRAARDCRQRELEDGDREQEADHARRTATIRIVSRRFNGIPTFTRRRASPPSGAHRRSSRCTMRPSGTTFDG